MNQDKPLDVTGWLRGINLTLEGSVTTSGPWRELFTDPKHKRAWFRRCTTSRCQRRRDHRGEHYRKRWPRGFRAWTTPDIDAPFNVIDKWEIKPGA